MNENCEWTKLSVVDCPMFAQASHVHEYLKTFLKSLSLFMSTHYVTKPCNKTFTHVYGFVAF